MSDDQTAVAPTESPSPTKPSRTRTVVRSLVIARNAMVVLGSIGLAVATHSFLTVLVILAVVGMIMIHEFGHFITAKWSGMKVTEFFFGFGPRLWSFKAGETEYGIKAIPAGGYVKIIGMNNIDKVDDGEEPRTYRAQPYWQRVMVTSAGSFMHFVMAFLLLVGLYAWLGVPDGSTSTTIDSVAQFKDGPSPAAKAGLQKGDKVLAVDNQTVKQWSDVQAYVVARPDTAINLTVSRHGKQQQLVLTPVDRRTVVLQNGKHPDGGTEQAVGFVGVSVAQGYGTKPFPSAVVESGKQMGRASVEVVKSIGHVFSLTGIRDHLRLLASSNHKAAVTTDTGNQTAAPASSSTSSEDTANDNRFVSVIGLVGYANHAVDSGLRSVFILLFSINIFVGIFNMLPLPPFDGGHVAVATYEKLRSYGGRRHMVDFNKLIPITYAVLFVLIFIGLSSMWLDIFHPAPNIFPE